MIWMIYMAFAISLLTFLYFAIFIIKRTQIKNRISKYDVFNFTDNHQLVVISGLHTRYAINNIQKVVFSIKKRRGRYIGVFRIFENNSKKSREYIFDSSAYKNKLVLVNTKEDIENTILFLMQQLHTQNIKSEYDKRL